MTVDSQRLALGSSMSILRLYQHMQYVSKEELTFQRSYLSVMRRIGRRICRGASTSKQTGGFVELARHKRGMTAYHCLTVKFKSCS